MKENEVAAIKALVAESGCVHSPELLEELIETALLLGRDKAPVADIKLIVRALKELRYASKVFQPYSDRRKVAVFGSARLAPTRRNSRWPKRWPQGGLARVHGDHGRG